MNKVRIGLIGLGLLLIVLLALGQGILGGKPAGSGALSRTVAARPARPQPASESPARRLAPTSSAIPIPIPTPPVAVPEPTQVAPAVPVDAQPIVLSPPPRPGRAVGWPEAVAAMPSAVTPAFRPGPNDPSTADDGWLSQSPESDHAAGTSGVVALPDFGPPADSTRPQVAWSAYAASTPLTSPGAVEALIREIPGKIEVGDGRDLPEEADENQIQVVGPLGPEAHGPRASLISGLREPEAARMASMGRWNEMMGRQSEQPTASPSDLPKPPPLPPAATPEPATEPASPAADEAEQAKAVDLAPSEKAPGGRLHFKGWLDQGITANGDVPADRYNGPVTFNDRDGEWQINQVYLYAERATDTTEHCWDWGGRVDLLFGTDARFTKAADGLEESWHETQPFYQAALPQFYLDVAYGDWLFRAGHFYTLLGYEVVPAPNNFFYSHSYTMQYGEPFTHTGMLLSRKFGERLNVTVGLQRGNDQFNDTDGLNAANFLMGVTWTAPEDKYSLAFGLSATEQGQDVAQTIYSLVGTWNVSERLKYVLQHDLGVTSVAGGADAQWYGLNQYLLYALSPHWGAGVRFEWFRDDDGTRVTGLGVGNLSQGPFVGNFYELTAGLNWKPGAHWLVRPEVRWDWYDADAPGGPLPYDAGNRANQFLFATDFVLSW